jgi:3-hydroxybutyryl-CoA dehydrogenase
VVGAGTMGHGIAYVAALTGCAVRITDANAATLDTARERIESLLAGGLKRGKITEDDRARVHARLETTPRLADAVAGADLVIEAIVEELGAKQRLLAEVERKAPPTALLASNTSSLSVGQIAAALKSPARLIGMHFFNPVHLMRLVEIVTHARTDAELVDRAIAMVKLLGKEPIVVKDSPGFASSRLGLVLGLEAMRMLEQGVASAEDIDKAMELGYNHPMGPLKLTDVVGLDVRLAIAEYLFKTLGSSQFEPPRILRDKVAKGELGKKSGRGFYVWSE